MPDHSKAPRTETLKGDFVRHTDVPVIDLGDQMIPDPTHPGHDFLSDDSTPPNGQDGRVLKWIRGLRR